MNDKIIVSHLSKIYLTRSKKTVKAIDDISFEVDRGKILILLGPNGSGKTTTLRCMSTLIKPSLGNIQILGYSIDRNPELIRKYITFLSTDLKLDPYFSADYLVTYFGRLHGMQRCAIEQRKRQLFDFFKIAPFADRPIQEYSQGMMQIVSLVVSLVHDPQVAIFDEPTNSLDVITARAVVDYILQLKQENKWVVVSTHLMDLVNKICDQLVILNNGKIMASGTTGEILAKTGQDTIENAFIKLCDPS